MTSFPIVAQSVYSGPVSPYTFGVLRLNFNDPVDLAPPYNGSRQAHVSVVHKATGNYAVSVPGIVITPHRGTPGLFSGRIGF